MRYVHPEGSPANDWPIGMRFDVLTNEPILLEMLYVRAMWSIPAGADIPDLVGAPPAAAVRPSDEERGELAAWWEESWARGIAWASQADVRNAAVGEFFIDQDRDPAELAAFLPPS